MLLWLSLMVNMLGQLCSLDDLCSLVVRSFATTHCVGAMHGKQGIQDIDCRQSSHRRHWYTTNPEAHANSGIYFRTLVVKGVRVDGCSQTWLDATDKLRVGLRMNPVTENVRVEIISWQLTRPRFTEALEQEHTIVEKWPRIRPQIHHHLDQKQVVKDHWLTIIVLRRGYIALESWYEYDDSSPTTSVVLLIIMSYDVDPWQWFAQENSIRKVLDQEGLSMVGVEFERGTNSPAAFALRSPTDDAKTADVIEKPYSVSIGLGADCGPARDFEQSPGTLIPGPCGTFGGWVWVTFPDGKKKKMLMTNFYVARDVLKGVSSSTAPDGIKPTRVDAPQGSEVDCQSP